MSSEKALDSRQLEQKPLGVTDIVLSRQPERALQEMMEIISALQAIYAEETDALKACNTKLFVALQPRKNVAIAKYHAGIQQIIARKDEFKKTRPELRAKLVNIQEDFFALTTVNMQALETVTKSVQRLGNRIMAAARRAMHKESPNYSKSGNMTKTERAVSIGINQSA